MKRNETSQVADSMNARDRAHAQRGMHQAMALGNLVNALTASVRGAVRSAGHAMTLVYGRPDH